MSSLHTNMIIHRINEGGSPKEETIIVEWPPNSTTVCFSTWNVIPTCEEMMDCAKHWI
jgi:hypothetical protein